MLAVYLAAPEVDNDRRALNIFHGICRGKKEGRWLGGCLRGYINTRDANNRPIIAPAGGIKEEVIKRAFTEFATGMYNIEELRRRLLMDGLKCSRNGFWLLLRNKGYIGKILVPAYKGEQAHWVDGSHVAIIDETTFYTVQDILDGRKKKIPAKFKTVRDEFPLRGHLSCPRCNKTLTASASKGRAGTLFYYYHCTNGCKERQKAFELNKQFLPFLSQFKTNPQTLNLYATILKDRLKEESTVDKKELENIAKSIGKQKLRLKNAKDLMLDGEFSASEFKDMKFEIEEEVDKLNRQEVSIRSGIENYDAKIDDCLDVLTNLDKYYVSVDTVGKQRIIGSMFPEKLYFENNEYRTKKINDAVELFVNNTKCFEGIKKGKDLLLSNLSHQVIPHGFEPWTAGLENLCSIQLSYRTISERKNTVLLLINYFFCNE